MDFHCSHCSQPLAIADHEMAALRGRATITCPSCGGKIALVKPPSPRPLAPAPIRAPGQLKPPPRSAAPSPAAAAPKKQRVKTPMDPAKMQRNLLVLGCAALLMLGSIAGYLATREAGKTVHIEQKIINKLIQNEYFQRLIRDGKTTAEALANIEDAYPYGKGFIGVSRVDHEWVKAQELARTTASEILDVTTCARQSRREVGEWIAATIPALKNHPVWVRDLSSQAVLDAPDILNHSTDRPRRVLLIWPAGEPWPNKGWDWAVQPVFEAVEAFDPVTGLARAKSGGRWGLIDLKGEWALKPEYDRIDPFSGRQSARIYQEGGGYGLVDHAGRVVAPPAFEAVQELIHGFVPVERGGKWGYLDSTGKQIIPNEWDDAWRFSSLGYAVVVRANQRGVVDREGKLVVKPEWNGIINFTPDGIGAVRRGNDWGLITPSGGLLTPVEYDLDWRDRSLDLRFISMLTKERKPAFLGLDGTPVPALVDAKSIEPIDSPRGALLRVTWRDDAQSLREEGGKELFRTQGKGTIGTFGKDGLVFVQDSRGGGYMDALGRLSAPLSPEQKGPPPAPYHGRSSQNPNRRSYGSEYGALPPGWDTKIVASRHVPASPYWPRFVTSMPSYLRPCPDLLAVDDSIVLTGMNPRHPVLDDLIPYAAPPKYGLIDAAGKVLVEPTWDEVRVLSRDWVLIRLGHRYGLADGAGKVVVQPDWDDIEVPYATYVSLANDGKTIQRGLEGERFRAPWILAYKAGKITVLLPDGKPALPDKIGNAQVKYVDFYGPSRLVIILQEIAGPVFAIFEPKSGDLVRFADAAAFRWNWNTATAGVIWMRDGKATTELWRLMDQKGKALGHTRLNRPDGWGFVEGRALHPTGEGWIFIDNAGQIIGGDQPWQEAHDFSEGRATVKKDGKWGFMDVDGKLLVEPVWQDARSFRHGRALVQSAANYFWGYLATDGSIAIPPIWTDADDFTELKIQRGSSSGKVISVPTSSSSYRTYRNADGWKGEAVPLTTGGATQSRPVARVSTGAAWSLIDPDGFLIADPISQPGSYRAGSYHPGAYWLVDDGNGQAVFQKRPDLPRGSWAASVTLSWVPKSGGWSLVNHENKELTDASWDMPMSLGGVHGEPFSGGLVTARNNESHYGLLRPDGTQSLEPSFDLIVWVAPGVFVAWNEKDGGLMDDRGKWLFRDNATHRIARFVTRRDRGTGTEFRHGLIVIEDVPKWGHVRLNRP